ncbi:uncharacterized protein TNCV_4139841 [Trichonephila clavipes]|nr:uncharacterized protein TNCV_4139841 [Trichonephila clavipes]
MPPNVLRVHTEYVLVKLVGPKVLWAESRVQGTGDNFSPLQSHGKIVEVEMGGVAIYRPFGEFRRANSYCHLNSPCDFDLILKVKEPIRGRRFVTQEDIANAMRQQVTRFTHGVANAEANAIQRLPHCRQRVVTVAGDYIDDL